MDKPFEKNDLIVHRSCKESVYRIDTKHNENPTSYILTNIITGVKYHFVEQNCKHATKEQIYRAITRRMLNGAQ